MQDWRFDDLTRTLGKATSRRGVLKGLIGGLALAAAGHASKPTRVAAASCGDVTPCRQDASAAFRTCRAAGGSIFDCAQQAAARFRYCWNSLCPAGQQCCGDQCVDVNTDRDNCGSCGYPCVDQNATCHDGMCVCPAGWTGCITGFGIYSWLKCCPPDTTCEQGAFGNTHCAKTCDPPCPACQACFDGECRAEMELNGVACGNGMVCCAGQCVEGTDCTCIGKPDGASCGGNNVCCGQQCVSDQCPAGKTFDSQSCTCQCTESCPPGQPQDPDTCQCQNLCENVSCGACQQCDPTSGHCVQVDDQTPCGNNQVCCGGTCQDSCNGNSCPSGQYACGVTQPYNPNNNNSRPDYWCCDNGSPCCGGNGYLYDVCQGSTYNGQYVCCAPGTNQCGGNCCDHNTQSCQQATDGSLGLFCCPADAGGVLPDGTCCDAGFTPYGCASGVWVCLNDATQTVQDVCS